MKHYFIMNPAAGKGTRFHTLIDEIHKVCDRRKVTYEIHITAKIGEATEYVKEVCSKSSEPMRFYACGGDGTITSKRRCDVCDGFGYDYNYYYYYYEYVSCYACSGKGYNTKNEYCYSCNDTGKCWSCEGTGEDSLSSTCYNCQGVGKVDCKYC